MTPEFIPRSITEQLYEYMDIFPAVSILGSRQCGKSTFVKHISNMFHDMVYVDLQNRDDLARLQEPNLFFRSNENVTICLDEIQLAPELFAVLRSEIDRNRRNGRFILLGSASRQLLNNSSESLAGRVGMIEMNPFSISEVNYRVDFSLTNFWFRGGYPLSYLAKNDTSAMIWLENFLKTYVEHDIIQSGFQVPPLQMFRLLSICANCQATMLNMSKIAEILSTTHPTIKKYIDILETTYLLRQLLPYSTNRNKRLVKSPKIYIRDNGILHSILRIQSFNDLMGHPIFGASWEGLVVEQVCQKYGKDRCFFYRTQDGNEADLIIESDDGIIMIECKASTAPQLTKGFWNVIDTLKPAKAFVVAPVSSPYKLRNNVKVCSITDLLQEI